MENNGWLNEFPKEPGNYWFYGDLFYGSMGCDYKDDHPPIEQRLYYVKVRRTSNSMIGTADGQIIFSAKFNQDTRKSGFLGYWKPADIIQPPIDILNLFKPGVNYDPNKK